MNINNETHLTLKLLFPNEPLIRVPDSIDILKVISSLRINRIPVACLPENPVISGLMEFPEFRVYMEGERFRYNATISPYNEINTAWIKAGVQSIVIKSPGYFPYRSDNLDILVSDRTAEKAGQILEDLGYIELPHIREPYKKLYRKIQGDFFPFPVHLHTRVAWINSFITGEELFRDLQRADGNLEYYYPSPENCLLITIAHWFYEDKAVNLRDLYNLSLILPKGINWDKVWNQTNVEGWSDSLAFALSIIALASERFGISEIRDCLPPSPHKKLPPYSSKYLVQLSDRQDISLPFNLSKFFCKAMHFKKSLRSKNLGFGGKLRDFFLLVWFMIIVKAVWLRRFPCYIVAISGVDGAGKTTLARNIYTELTDIFSIHAEYHWGRVASSGLLETIKSPYRFYKQIRKNSGPISGDPNNIQSSIDTKHLLQKHPRVNTVWGSILIIEYVFRQWFLYLLARLRGGIHIFDRHLIDAMVELETVYHFKNSQILYQLIPAANIGLYISIDEETALKRSTSPAAADDLTSSLRLYKAYNESFSKAVSAQNDLDTLTEEAVSFILQRYYQRIQ